MKKKISVLGLGYVGVSNAVLLARNHDVVAMDIDQQRVNSINSKVSPVVDQLISDFMLKPELSLRATTNLQEACNQAEYVIIAAPTDYDEVTRQFDTSIVEEIIEDVLLINKSATLVIKSTIPIGFVRRIRQKFNTERIFFSPEFLREGSALYDNLHPNRIIAGDSTPRAKDFVQLMLESSLNEDAATLFTGPDEAEAIKLFANSYLAMRVAYFNELDTFAHQNNMQTNQIIEGVSLDPRVGLGYNNPSFGYGGYCLPKDTKQLLANYAETPQEIIQAIVNSNKTRMEFIVDCIVKTRPNVVGFYRLVMKQGSDNLRQSANIEIMKMVIERGYSVVVYEPVFHEDTILGQTVINDLSTFLNTSEIIVANRMSDELINVRDKVFTRDLYTRD